MAHQAAYIVERFVSGWRRAHAAGFGCYRGMVVARSRQHVAWYAMVGGAGQLVGVARCMHAAECTASTMDCGFFAARSGSTWLGKMCWAKCNDPVGKSSTLRRPGV